jgi:hypothetical protein
MTDGEPNPEDLGLSEEDMQTPEQRAERAERLADFRNFAEPMLAPIYSEGKTPFGLSRDMVIAKTTERIFSRVEEENLQPDHEFMSAATEVVTVINTQVKVPFVVGKYQVNVLRHYLAKAAGVNSDVDLADVNFTMKTMEANYQAATGRTLEEWAKDYIAEHPNVQIDQTQNLGIAQLFNDDYNQHSLTASHFATVLREHSITGELDINDALKVLLEKGFIVPEEWSEEYAGHADGQTLLEAIENMNEELQIAEIVQTLESSYVEFVPAEELPANPIEVKNVLTVASLGTDIPENWGECDDRIKAVIKAAMKELAYKLGGKLGTSKGAPIIKFEKK